MDSKPSTPSAPIPTAVKVALVFAAILVSLDIVASSARRR